MKEWRREREIRKLSLSKASKTANLLFDPCSSTIATHEIELDTKHKLSKINNIFISSDMQNIIDV